MIYAVIRRLTKPIAQADIGECFLDMRERVHIERVLHAHNERFIQPAG